MKMKILTQEELKIVELLSKDLLSKRTIREIARMLDKKSYNWVFKAV